MFSISPGQGLVEHIFSWNYGWKLCEKEKEVMLDEKMGKVAKGKKKKERQKKKKKVFLYVLKILCWKSLKSKEVKHWWLKMKNLYALMEYLVWNIIFS